MATTLKERNQRFLLVRFPSGSRPPIARGMKPPFAFDQQTKVGDKVPRRAHEVLCTSLAWASHFSIAAK